MTQKWKEVWNRRTAPEGAELDLSALIRLDGCDTGAGLVAADDWRSYAINIATRLGLQNGNSLFDVGCGSGAFLYAVREQFSIKVGGIDYAAGLIAAAKRVMPDGDFAVGDALAMNPNPAFDYVVSAGVFHYFEINFAEQLIDLMIRKSKHAIAILEVPDLRTKNDSEMLRRNALSQAEYEKKYKGLEHTYYSREWFVSQAVSRGLPCEIFGSCLPNSLQRPYRFNCMIRMA